MDCKHIAARCSKSPPYSSLSISIVVLSSFNTPRPLFRESMFARVKWIARDKALTIFVHNLLQYELPVATHIAIDYCQYLMARTKALLYGNKEILHPKTRSCLAESSSHHVYQHTINISKQLFALFTCAIVSFTIYLLQISDFLARFRFLCFNLAYSSDFFENRKLTWSIRDI